MPVERSAGAVIFHREEKNIKYLLLRYPFNNRSVKDYWDFPKGHIEKGEKEINTVRREVAEEAGLTSIEITKGFKAGIKYFFRAKGQNILKFVTFYLAETKSSDVRISDEHLGFEWLDYPQALERLTFDNAKEILRQANDFLIQNGIVK